jgi:hypothetical protein
MYFKVVNSGEANLWSIYKNGSLDLRWDQNFIFINSTFRENLSLDIKSVLKQPKPKYKGKVYISKWCKIPRHRIEAYIKENNITRVWSYKDADYVVMDKKEVKNLYNIISENSTYLPGYRGGIYKFCYEFPRSLVPVNNLSDWEKRRYIKGGKDYIISDNKVSKFTPYLIKDIEFVDLDNKSKIELLELFKYKFENPNSFDVVFDEQYFEDLNSDSFVLNEEVLDNINMMFKSKQIDSIKLSLEMLSNCNIKDNIVSIALMFNENQNVFKGDVLQVDGFKILRGYLEQKGIDYKTEPEIFISKMMEVFPNEKDKYTKFVLNRVNHNLKFYGANFELDSVTIKE